MQQNPTSKQASKQEPCLERSAGFTLIMMSILLTVAALVFVSVLPGKEAGDVNQKNSDNTKKLERVEEAMRSFMAANGRRPCPADGQYAENTANFGKEAGTPGTCTGNTSPTPNAPLGPDAGTGYVVGGVIPTRSLGLPDEYQYDEFGRRFTYVVDKRATESLTAAIANNTAIIAAGGSNVHAPGCYNLTQSIKTAGANPGITIENATGGTVIDYTMYAYISHGKSGYGAWPAQGASSPAGRINSGSTDADMQTNAGVNGSFAYSTSNFTNVKILKDRVAPTTGDTGFDDLVWYRTDLKDTCCLGSACKQPGFIVEGGTVANNQLGYAMAVGDVNGDGIPDLVITAADNNQTGMCMVAVIFGTKTGFPDPLPIAWLNGTNGFTMTSPAYCGPSTSLAVGDINGDGYADIVSGGGNHNGNSNAYVLYGHAAPWTSTFLYSTLNGTNGFAITLPATASGNGAVMAVGDFNGDGYADIIIGGPVQGASYASGSIRWGVIPTDGEYITLNGVKWYFCSTSCSGTQATDYLTNQTQIQSTWLATVTQIKSDLTSCIANPSCPNYSTLNVATYGYASGDGGISITYNTAGSAGNAYTLSAGTFTSATASGATLTGGLGGPSNLTQGSTYVLFGAPDVSGVRKMKDGTTSWPASLTLSGGTAPLNGTDGVEFDGAAAGIEAGASVAIKDVNGDGIADLIIGAPYASPNAVSQAGSVYVVFGTASAWTTPQTLNSALFNSGAAGFELDGLGASYEIGLLVTSGDVNGDGIADMLIAGDYSWAYGTYGVFGRTSWTGTPYTLTTAWLNGTNGFVLTGSLGSNQYPAEYGTIADVNGDGYGDIITGGAYKSVIFGKSVWPSSTPVTLAWLNGINGTEFTSASTTLYDTTAAGDVNGDGIADIIYGSQEADGVYVYFGHKNTTAWPTSGFSLDGL